jgi:hypothetical protein
MIKKEDLNRGRLGEKTKENYERKGNGGEKERFRNHFWSEKKKKMESAVGRETQGRGLFRPFLLQAERKR